MTPQDFKALLDVLNRIATALEGKEKNVAVETVNRFAEVYRSLLSIQECMENMRGSLGSGDAEEFNRMMLEAVINTHIKHAKIANEILQVYQQK